MKIFQRTLDPWFGVLPDDTWLRDTAIDLSLFTDPESGQP